MLGTCSDSAVFKNWVGANYTPVCGQLFNLPPHVRSSFGGLFLLGVFPKNMKKGFSFYYDYLLNRMQTKFSAFTGFPVEWGDTLDKTNMKLRVVNDVQDIKGLPNICCCKTTGSYVGACPWCKAIGIRGMGKTAYPTAVSFLPKSGHEDPYFKNRATAIRRKAKEEFKNIRPELKKRKKNDKEKKNDEEKKVEVDLNPGPFTKQNLKTYHAQTRAGPMTRQQAIASGMFYLTFCQYLYILRFVSVCIYS